MQDLIWPLAGLLLTLLVFSYLLGDNFLFRLASYIFVGVVAGYVFVLIIYQVILPKIFWPLLNGTLAERGLALIPLVLSALLLAKLSPRLGRLGRLPMAYLVGVGAAVAIGGAVLGTLFTQTGAAIQAFDFDSSGGGLWQLIEGSFLLLGTISTLLYFQFSASVQPDQSVRRPAAVEALARAGQVFIAITLGALFASVYAASVTALIDRLEYIVDAFERLIFPLIF